MKALGPSLALLALMFAVASAKPVTLALPPEPEVSLKPGEGADLASTACAACHSLDYIATQPPQKGAAFWEAEVKKMRETYGASLSDADAKSIAAYLAKAY